jgi:hypothetical protein
MTSVCVSHTDAPIAVPSRNASSPLSGRLMTCVVSGQTAVSACCAKRQHAVRAATDT